MESKAFWDVSCLIHSEESWRKPLLTLAAFEILDQTLSTWFHEHRHYADAQAIQHAVRSLGAARTKGKLRSARERAACAGSMLLWKYRWSDVRGCM